MVVAANRFRKYGEHCPICEGHAGKKPGRGERCAGFVSDDGEYVYCTREEFAGNLELNEKTQPAAFCHKMHGPCNCGVQHGPPDLKIVPERRIVNEYTYYGADGRVAYQSLRYEPKDFSQRQPDGKGGYTWNMHGVTKIPYRLPELLKANPDSIVYIVEGEKDADNLARLGLVATTNVGGAGNWQESCNRYFKGRQVVILPDNDEAGRDHARKVTKSLTGIAASVRTIELLDLPEKGDVSDWLETGGTREKLETLCKPAKRKFTYASEVEEQPIDYIWDRRVAKGCFTLAVGDAGVGKGLTLMAMIRAVTRGETLPGGPAIAPGGVILMSPEDPASRVLIPRLKAANVDLTKVLLLTEVTETSSEGETYQRPVSFPEDAHILREAIEDAGAVLVIIDPVLSLLSGKVDAHKNHAVRQALAHVISTADKHNCAVLGVMHTTKAPNPNVLFRSSSSSAFIEMARAALFFVPDPDGEQGQSGVIVNYKNNLTKHASSIRYSIHQNEKQIGYITWEGESTYTRDELLNQSTPANNTKSEREEDIVSVLKENGEAMTLAELLPYTKGESGALRMMLSRKVEQGIILRTARGKYTYVGNPLYEKDVTNVTSVANVTNVTNVASDIEYNNVTNDVTNETALEARSQQSNICNTNNNMSEMLRSKQKRDDRGFFRLCQVDKCTWPNETAHNGLCKRHWQEMREAQS